MAARASPPGEEPWLGIKRFEYDFAPNTSSIQCDIELSIRSEVVLEYSLLLPDGMFALSAARPPVGARAIVETDDELVTGSVTIRVSH